ncbi:MAG: polysaccharide deacetylase, partial [Solirubrobacterales bacterium]|nr:polysaccharide deacetylase [Solirubrobacterales bacterium]
MWTPRVLDALRAAGARATFFVLSDRAAAHRDVVGRARAEGHRVELHGEAHLRHPDVPRAAVERDTDRALAALGRLGVEPALWRLPWGRPAPWSEEVA